MTSPVCIYSFILTCLAADIEDEPPVTAAEAAVFDQQFGDRWRTLLSVDDLVGAVVAALAAENLLDSTFVFYSSDVRS